MNDFNTRSATNTAQPRQWAETVANIHRLTVRAAAIISLGYCTAQTYALSAATRSVIEAVAVNAPLFSINAFFGLSAWLLIHRHPDAATFAAMGGILTAMVI